MLFKHKRCRPSHSSCSSNHTKAASSCLLPLLIVGWLLRHDVDDLFVVHKLKSLLSRITGQPPIRGELTFREYRMANIALNILNGLRL
uniref:Uncharacterized protein n=1 Tax=Trichuris muris TaxID=70415 RepID=A0A5S6QIM1_TRIMR